MARCCPLRLTYSVVDVLRRGEKVVLWGLVSSFKSLRVEYCQVIIGVYDDYFAARRIYAVLRLVGFLATAGKVNLGP